MGDQENLCASTVNDDGEDCILPRKRYHAGYTGAFCPAKSSLVDEIIHGILNPTLETPARSD